MGMISQQSVALCQGLCLSTAVYIRHEVADTSHCYHIDRRTFDTLPGVLLHHVYRRSNSSTGSEFESVCRQGGDSS